VVGEGGEEEFVDVEGEGGEGEVVGKRSNYRCEEGRRWNGEGIVHFCCCCSS